MKKVLVSDWSTMQSCEVSKKERGMGVPGPCPQVDKPRKLLLELGLGGEVD